MRRVRWFRLEHLARTRLWLLPLACVLTGIGLGVAMLSIDKASGYKLVGHSVTGSAASVQTILTVASTAQSIRVGGLIGLVGDETRGEVERLYQVSEEAAEDPSVVPAPEYGVVVKLHHRALVAIAKRADCVLEMVPAMGDFVPRGAPLLRVRGSLPDNYREAVGLSVIVACERSHESEPAFGIRKLVDIAERSIYSSPYQDPTTSVQAINAIHDVLRRLAVREFPSGVRRDSDGHPRLIERVMTWEGYVRLAFDELRLAGAGSPQVARRMRAALDDLKAVAPSARHPPLDDQLELLEAAVRRAYADEADVRAALVPDMQGLGSGTDMMSFGEPAVAHHGLEVRTE